MLQIVATTSCFGGLAYHLWKNDLDTWGKAVSAMVLSGIGGGLTLLWLWSEMQDSPEKMAVISVLSGIGATTLIDFGIYSLQRWVRSKLS